MRSRKNKRCQACKTVTGLSYFGLMSLNKKNRALFSKSHMDLCFDCALSNDVGKEIGGK